MHRYAKLQLFIIFCNYLATFSRMRTLRMRTTDFALRKATTGEYTATTYKQKGKENLCHIYLFTEIISIFASQVKKEYKIQYHDKET